MVGTCTITLYKYDLETVAREANVDDRARAAGGDLLRDQGGGRGS